MSPVEVLRWTGAIGWGIGGDAELHSARRGGGFIAASTPLIGGCRDSAVHRDGAKILGTIIVKFQPNT